MIVWGKKLHLMSLHDIQHLKTSKFRPPLIWVDLNITWQHLIWCQRADQSAYMNETIYQKVYNEFSQMTNTSTYCLYWSPFQSWSVIFVQCYIILSILICIVEEIGIFIWYNDKVIWSLCWCFNSTPHNWVGNCIGFSTSYRLSIFINVCSRAEYLEICFCFDIL